MAVARVGLSKKTRFEVFKRDGFVCQYCGAHPPDVILEPDHIVPVCEGGTNDEHNLVTACFDCNRGKAGNSLNSVPKSLHERAADIAEIEAQLAGYRKIIQGREDRIYADMWQVAEALAPGSPQTGMRKDWLRSIKTFNQRLPLHEVIDAAELALARKPFSDPQKFKYFCGICWNKVRDGVA